MHKKIILTLSLMHLPSLGSSFERGTNSTHQKLDTETSQQFLSSAYRLVSHAYELSEELSCGTPRRESSSPGALQTVPKKKFGLRSLRLKRRRKLKKAISTSNPNLLAASSPYTKEHAVDAYLGALSLYASTYHGQSPSRCQYIKTHITQAMHALEELISPIQLDAPTTLFDPAYAHVLHKAKAIMRDPCILESVLHDMQHQQTSIRKNDTNYHILFMHLHTLLNLHNTTDPYQQTLVQSYAHQTLKLLTHQEIKPSNLEEHQALLHWTTIQREGLNFTPFLAHLQNRFKQHSLLCHTLSAQKKEAFRIKLIQEQTHTLYNLLYIHKNTDVFFQRYWLAKEAAKLLHLVGNTLIRTTKDKKWNIIYGKWHKESEDVITTLDHINRCVQTALPTQKSSRSRSELQKQQTLALCFNALPILVDIYEQFILPPTLLQRITVPMRMILDTLINVSAIIPLDITTTQDNLLTKANSLTCTLTREYATKYHCNQADTHMEHSDRIRAKQHYISAAKELFYARQQTTDPLLLNDIAQHIYTSLLYMLELHMDFSADELISMVMLANELDLPLTHPKLLMRWEAMKLSAFLQKLKKSGALDPSSHACSSSSSKK